jgi:hypothetical protein
MLSVAAAAAAALASVRGLHRHWPCDVMAAMSETSSCDGNGVTDCELKFERSQSTGADSTNNVSLCVLTGGSCSASEAVECRQPLPPRAMGSALTHCIAQAADVLLPTVKGQNASAPDRYAAMFAAVVAQLDALVPHMYSVLGFGGLQACLQLMATATGDAAALQGLSQEELIYAHRRVPPPTPSPLEGVTNTTAVHLMMFNSLICPNFEGDDADGRTWQLGALRMDCERIYNFPLRDLVDVQADGLKLMFLSQRPPLRNASHMPYTGHSWGCRYGDKRRLGRAFSTSYRYSRAADPAAQARPWIRHLHLPPAACDIVRHAELQRPLKLQELQAHLGVCD